MTSPDDAARAAFERRAMEVLGVAYVFESDALNPETRTRVVILAKALADQFHAGRASMESKLAGANRDIDALMAKLAESLADHEATRDELRSTLAAHAALEEQFAEARTLQQSDRIELENLQRIHKSEDRNWRENLAKAHVEAEKQRIRADRAEADTEALRVEGRCDACGGTGLPVSGKTCMCGGSGNAVDAVTYLRERVFELETETERLREDDAAYGAGSHPGWDNPGDRMALEAHTRARDVQREIDRLQALIEKHEESLNDPP